MIASDTVGSPVFSVLISSAVLTETDDAVFFMSRATFSPVTTIGFNTVVPAASAC
ncbi:hypothetical protein D3C87_999890 [compost metagenome]